MEIFAAGSLRLPLPEILYALDMHADITFGPAGLLRKRVEEGSRPSLYFSANIEHAKAVSALNGFSAARPFAENSLCLLGTKKALISDDPLAAMLDENNRLATSTPGADPGGDYAQQVIKKADGILNGSSEILLSKVMHLVGSTIGMENGISSALSPVARLFAEDRTDLFLGYRTSAIAVMQNIRGLKILALPLKMSVKAIYWMTPLDSESATRKADRIIENTATAILLEKYGFISRI